MKSIYTYYKERLIEISGKNRSLYLRNFNKKNGYDLGKILYGMPEMAEELLDNLWKGKSLPFNLICAETKEAIAKAHNIDTKYPDKEFENDKDKKKYERQKKSMQKKFTLKKSKILKS